MRFQFSLQALLLSAVVVWSSLAAFGVGGLVLAGMILAVAGYLRRSESLWRDTAIVGVIFLCGLCLLSSYLIIVDPGELSYRATCVNNLEQIGLAMHIYHNTYGCYPPPYIPDQNGKPMHSWRVLLLPWLEQAALYEQYDFSEPWDGPNNRKLAQAVVPAYQCPGNWGWHGASPMTDYVAVIGPGTAWAKGTGMKVDEIADGTDNTIMLVEIADSGIHWMEPKDLLFEDARKGINPKLGAGISSRHVRCYRGASYFYEDPPVVNVAFANGHVCSLPEAFPDEILEALLTADGGEDLEADSLDAYLPKTRLDRTHCLGLAALVVSTVLLLIRPRQREVRGGRFEDGLRTVWGRILNSE